MVVRDPRWILGILCGWTNVCINQYGGNLYKIFDVQAVGTGSGGGDIRNLISRFDIVSSMSNFPRWSFEKPNLSSASAKHIAGQLLKKSRVEYSIHIDRSFHWFHCVYIHYLVVWFTIWLFSWSFPAPCRLTLKNTFMQAVSNFDRLCMQTQKYRIGQLCRWLYCSGPWTDNFHPTTMLPFPSCLFLPLMAWPCNKTRDARILLVGPYA